MTTDAAATQGPPIIFDGWRSISISLYMALVGYSVMVTMPVLSTALVNLAGFTEEQVGRVWGADLYGLSIGAVISALLVSRVNRRYLVGAGVALAVLANALCLNFVEYDQVLWLRVLAGIGSGIFTAVAIVTLGGTTNPVRSFTMLLFAFSFSGFVQLHILDLLPMNGIYLFFMGTFGVCGLFLRWIPTRALNVEELAEQEKSEKQHDNWNVPRFMPVVCLTAICFTYINLGGTYAYIELAALADGVSEDWSIMVLKWGSVFAMVGCGLAMLCTRFGLSRPLIVSLLVIAGVVAMFSGGINDANYMGGVFVFFTMWTFVDVYQEAMLSHMDRSGSFLALVPAVQGFGNGVGPNLAASIVGAGLGYSVVFLACSGMALVAMFIYIGITVYMHKRKPVQAETA